MDTLQNFQDKNMIEQIMILDEIRESGQGQAISALFDIYSSPLPDTAVDEMVYHALISLLRDDHAQILAGFNHEALRVKLLCIKAAGENGVSAALDPLKKMLESCSGDIEFLTEVVRALSRLDDPALFDVLLPYMKHEDATVAGLAMEKASNSGEPGRDSLCDYITSACATGDNVLGIGLALTKLGKFTDEKAISFLTSHIHNENPTIRKIVHEQLIHVGKEALPTLQKVLGEGDKDEKIMAANVIGLIGDKVGADILTELLDGADSLEANLKFAAYEALGRIPSMRSVVGLCDGLSETDEMILVAVMTALNDIFNPGVAKMLIDTLGKDADQKKRILSALVTTRAGKLFGVVCQDGNYLDELMDILVASRNTESMEFFKEILASLEGEQAGEALKKLEMSEGASGDKRILAADDSKAMIFFYTSATAEMNVSLTTAEDGLQALNLLKSGEEFDLLITDLNMPNMDGIELVREVRNTLQLDIPILMASTESEKSQTDLAREAGVTDFITKPFTKEVLKEKVDGLF
ncbi:MAG: response regulator [Desulfobulbaceae bacterium]|nr:response regulator [Desulfobulbaceae bacterium]